VPFLVSGYFVSVLPQYTSLSNVGDGAPSAEHPTTPAMGGRWLVPRDRCIPSIHTTGVLAAGDPGFGQVTATLKLALSVKPGSVVDTSLAHSGRSLALR
jgi:hypothetical protein